MQIKLFDQVPSTQDLAKEYLLQSPDQACAFVAKSQTNGYGKNKRIFYSPRTGLYFSLAFPNYNWPNSGVGMLTPAVGVAIVQVLNRYFTCNLSLKWVNDLILDFKKVGGILTERIGDHLVVGVGINLTTDFTNTALTDLATSLNPNQPYDHQQLCQDLVDQVEQAVLHFNEPVYYQQYLSMCSTIGKKVILQVGASKIAALVQGITSEGNLMIEHAGQTQILSSAEVLKVNYQE